MTSSGKQRQANTLKNVFSKLSFEELQELKSDLGSKLFEEAYFSKNKGNRRISARENKNRPREESSRQPASQFRTVVEVPTNIRRDPRFGNLSATYNQERWKRSYGFIREIKEKERKELKKELRNEQDALRIRQIKMLLQRMENQQLEEKKREEKKKRRRDEIGIQKQRLKDGKRPHFLTTGERKAIDIMDQYDRMKNNGKLVKYLKRKNKKNAMKQLKLLQTNSGPKRLREHFSGASES